MSFLKSTVFYVAGILALGHLIMHFSGTVAEQREIIGQVQSENAQLESTLDSVQKEHARVLAQLEREKNINEDLLRQGQEDAQRNAEQVQELELTIGGLVRENAELKSWGDRRLPVAAVRLWNRTAENGNGGADHGADGDPAGGPGSRMPAGPEAVAARE